MVGVVLSPFTPEDNRLKKEESRMTLGLASRSGREGIVTPMKHLLTAVMMTQLFLRVVKLGLPVVMRHEY
jgi:hypothetical protein